jgi:DNA-binding transcriptional regulator GbsR (MarR family)
MPDGLSIGSLRHVEPYLLHGKIDSGKLIDDITTGSDKAKSFLREVNNLGSLDKISPTINSLIDEKIKSMFKQGFSKGSETTSDLSKIISDLSNMHDSMKSLSDSDYGDVVNPKNKQTLQAAKALNEVVKSSDFDPKKISQIEETVKNLKKIDNTDNPAIKAAEILDRLGKAQEKISTVSKNLPDVKKTKIRDWMENSVMKPFVKFLNDIHFSEKTKQQRNQLGEIEAGIKTPRGRDLIKDKIYDAEKTIDIANKIKREALLKSTVAGGFAGEKDVAPAIPQISQEEMLKMKLRNEANQALAKRLSGAL